jgi:hypothetical protein
VAELVVEGHGCLPDRDAVVALVEPGPRADQTALDVDRELTAERDRDRDPFLLLTDVQRTFARLVERAQRGGPPQHDEIVEVLAGLTDPVVRDVIAMEWVTWLSEPLDDQAGRPDHHDAVTSVLLQLAVACDGPAAAPPLTLYALQCWSAGDGALANVAVDRALALDAGYTMAQLVEQVLASGLLPHGVPPFETQ